MNIKVQYLTELSDQSKYLLCQHFTDLGEDVSTPKKLCAVIAEDVLWQHGQWGLSQLIIEIEKKHDLEMKSGRFWGNPESIKGTILKSTGNHIN